MTLDEYQRLAHRTSSAGSDRNRGVMICALGLVGETGEVADEIKKYIGHGHELNLGKMTKELGDVFCYIAEAAGLGGLRLAEVGERRDWGSDLGRDMEASVCQQQFEGMGRHLAITRHYVGDSVLGQQALSLVEAASAAADRLARGGLPISKQQLGVDLFTMVMHVVNLATLLGLDLDAILAVNLAKLEARYPVGFSSDASVHRVEG
jgi:NTP pyrophosphatase (non-canonical NTP hydrolase)